MEQLNELAQLLDGYKLRHLEVLTQPTEENLLGPGQKYPLVWQAYLQGQWQEEKDLAAFLGLPLESRPLRRFKRELRRRLFLPLLFVDPEIPGFNPAQGAYLSANRSLAILQTLIAHQAWENAYQEARRLFAQAQQHHFAFIGRAAARFLKHYHSVLVPDAAAYAQYQAADQTFQMYQAAEEEAANSYQQLLLPFTRSRARQQDLAQTAANYLLALEPYRQQGCSSQLFLGGYFYIGILEKLLRYDWRGCIAVAQQGLAEIRQAPFFSNRIVRLLLNNQLLAHIRLEEYAEGAKILSEVETLENEQTKFWLNAQETYLYFFFQTKQYQKAWERYCQIYQHPLFGVLPEAQKELWHIYAAYLNLLVDLSLVTVTPTDRAQVASFKLSRFLNEVPTFSQDKRGLNLAILILQILYLLKTRHHDEVLEKVEGLRRYLHRYFPQPAEHYRTLCFVQLLRPLGRIRFNRQAYFPLAAVARQQLAMLPRRNAPQQHELEPIPYEELTLWIAEWLD